MKSSRVLGFLLAAFLIAGAQDVLSQQAYTSGSGKTFGNEVELATLPVFRMTSTDSLNGRPLFDYFMLIKAKLNGVYDIEGGLQAEETFNLSKIDAWGTDDTRRFWMDMHQSQVRFRGQRETEGGPLIAYLEGDFWGGNKHFRLRHLWVDYKMIHFGQDWSFFGDKEIWPNVMDWDGPSSGVWRREPELKFYFETENHWIFDFGVANPGAEITFSADFDETVTSAYQSMPDVIGAVWKKADWGHIRATGIYRKLKYTAVTLEKSTPGYGATVSGLIKTNKELGNPVQFQLVGGTGIATYLVSFSGLNYDAAPDGKGDIKSIPTYGGWASYEHFLNPRWHINFVGGFSLFKSHAIGSYTIPGPGYEATDSEIDLKLLYGLFNVMWTPVPAMTFGVEYNIGQKTSRHEGTINKGTEDDPVIVSVEEESRLAQRISFGVFFDF
jgi:hypothetical protein